MINNKKQVSINHARGKNNLPIISMDNIKSFYMKKAIKELLAKKSRKKIIE